MDRTTMKVQNHQLQFDQMKLPQFLCLLIEINTQGCFSGLTAVLRKVRRDECYYAWSDECYYD